VPGVAGPVYAATRSAGPSSVTSTGTFPPVAANFTTVATLSNLPIGSYEIISKSSLNDSIGDSAVCQLTAGSSVDQSQIETSSGYDSGAEATNALAVTLTSPGSATLSCWLEGGTWSAADTSIVAVQAGSVTTAAVTG
jgi:hypothetical protein